MKIGNIKIKKGLACLVGLLALMPSAAHAARFMVETVAQEGSVEAYVYFHPEGETVNALQGSLRFPASLLRLERVEDGRSIVQLWVQHPELQDGAIHFSGIIPGGFSGMVLPDSESLTRGPVFKAVFAPVRKGEGEVVIEGTGLKNDGAGTMLAVTSGIAAITTAPGARQGETGKDIVPPEPFLPHVVESSGIETEGAVLVFQAADKQSGVAYYQVRERKPGILHWNAWHDAESPYLLRDQTRTSFIYVRAVDQAGNERIEALSPEHLPQWYDKGILELSLAAGLVILFGWYLKRRRS